MKSVTVKLDNNCLFFTGLITVDSVVHAKDLALKLMPKKSDTVLELDFKEVKQSDSSAMALILFLMREAKKRKIQIDEIKVTDKLINIARVSGLDSILPLRR